MRSGLATITAGGWIEPYLIPMEGRLVHASIPTTHKPGKHRPVGVYKRTSKPLPEHPCEATDA